ncbi:MAG TPA: DUF5054 domain-containing protein [Bryobacteraceae bacterium]|nr:DUF5054 domain-containing protein [Bryobacteraceae bacterium]
MKRRELIKTLAGSAAWTRLGAQTPPAPDGEVKRVVVMFKCHLDVGFTDTQAGVMRKYFDVYYPAAIERAAAMRRAGGDRYVWTTGSWMLYEYLEQAKSAERKTMERAIAGGDIAWHALPFSWQSEVLDRSLMSGAIGFSKSLDKRFGRKTSGAKMTDVPGHTLGLVAALSENGVKFLHIGVNSASTPPEVPSLFVWKNAEGVSIVVMYQHKGYGGVVRVPGSDLAIAIAMGDDNTGPHSMDEIRQIYADLRRQFPSATITASDLTGIANAVDGFRTRLPVVTQEIGDTWIHGVASDPVKVARYREIARLRGQWLRQGRLKVGDATDLAFLRRFALVGEHTWGTDTKTYLDHDHYKPQDLRAALDQTGYKKMTTSWAEKRDNIDVAVETLPASMRGEAKRSLAALKPVEPRPGSLQPFDARNDFESAHITLALDSRTGAIRRLRFKSTGREWASANRTLALFSYQTFSKADYDRFLESYVTSKADWAPQDFGKPNIEHFGAQSRVWEPKLLQCWAGTDARGDRVLAQLGIDDPGPVQSGLAAWPARMYLELIMPRAEPALEINFYCFDKIANRLPEAMWLTFRPDAAELGGWTLDKSDCAINPLEVVRGGNRHMHSLGRGLSYRDKGGGLAIDTMDAPVIALGEKSPIYFSYDQPDVSRGIHFSLYNNTWGTNYIQWFGEDVRFRFRVRPL